MSDEVVIRVENLSKKYTIRHANGRSSGDGLRHVLQDAAAPWRALRKFGKPKADGGKMEDRGWKIEASTAPSNSNLPSPNSQPSPSIEEFFALRDVSFEVRRGEILGIIGRNGAGKSTLLKILSRITEPTSGRIGIKGRVASLLEVGTGFHPELTGRENIFLNGAILGMTQTEVKRKFHEIVDFSGTAKFLDTPVKHYSSGMYVRLAFAVAAHLEPEILIVDEVLAVGDIEFQKKCLGKMRDVAVGGRTVLFVSHNMSAVTTMCGTAIQLDSGTIRAHGNVDRVIKGYVNGTAETIPAKPRQKPYGKNRHIISIVPRDMPCKARKPLIFDVSVSQSADRSPCHFSIHINNEDGVNIATISTQHRNSGMLQGNLEKFSVRLENPLLTPGGYSLDAFLYSGGIIDSWAPACNFDVNDSVATIDYSPQSAHGCKLVLSEFELITRE